MKILNLYAGIGGNRKLWGDSNEITAVEYREDIADVYRHYFPDDVVIITDAHQYLLDHYHEYDFIWSSPPCPTHSKSRFWRHSTLEKQAYPDMTLYQEIIFLKHYFKGKYVVENVEPFYDPLIPPTKTLGRHYFWANFRIGNIPTQKQMITEGKREDWSIMHGFDLSGFKIESRKDQIYRNCVDPEIGKWIMDCARGIITRKTNETSIF